VGAEWNAAAATHLYRRAGFGAPLEKIRWAAGAGRDAALDDLFARREHDARLMAGIRPILALEDIAPVQAWWMALILADTAPLVERVALMWHDHFATSDDKVGDARLMHAEIELFREKGLGDFRELLHAVARDPAMLVWLDGNSNRRGQPNENFAREVLELFALGIGHYTERDVREAARAFTGWGVDRRRFVFREQYHDPGPKEILGQRGAFGGDEALDVLLRHPASPRHVAHKLLEEFVGPDPSAERVDEWAGILVECDWNVERTLRRLFESEMFYSGAARRSRISGPVELVAITMITLGAKAPPGEVAEAAGEMGQSLFRPPGVKGWDGGRSWVHAGSWLARHNHLTALAMAHGAEAEGVQVDLAAGLGNPGAPGDVAEAARALLLPDLGDGELFEALRRVASEGVSLDETLRRVTALALTAPEYHLV